MVPPSEYELGSEGELVFQAMEGMLLFPTPDEGLSLPPGMYRYRG